MLAAELAEYLGAAENQTRDSSRAAAAADERKIAGLIVPHAGLMYSGPVAAHAYRLLRECAIETVVLVGPSHFVAFDGVAVYSGDGFETPFGVAAVDRVCTDALLAATPVVTLDLARAHDREHSLEMQLPFLKLLVPNARIVPLLMGRQTAATSQALGDALGQTLCDRPALLVASSDLSHYHDATTAARLDAVVLNRVERFDDEGLQRVLDERPEHACGGGPMVAVMRAARRLGADRATILNYADSGDISGDKTSVVGYLAAALWGSRKGGA